MDDIETSLTYRIPVFPSSVLIHTRRSTRIKNAVGESFKQK